MTHAARMIHSRYIPRCVFYFVLILGIVSCSQPPRVEDRGTIAQVTISALEKSDSPTPIPSPSQLVEFITTVPTVQPKVEKAQVCSPLEGLGMENLREAVSNPYKPPPAGSDDPHQGVDLADMSPDRVARSGMSVQAVLTGKIAMVTGDRFPYGITVLVETPLDLQLSEWTETLDFPNPVPTLPPPASLTCPLDQMDISWEGSSRSLYVLYAHLGTMVLLQPGEMVSCGQTIGAIGQSGNALNPHLHLEMRIGPSGARFGSMAHYDNSASLQEMANYCVWRVSQRFQVIDPFRILGLDSNGP